MPITFKCEKATKMGIAVKHRGWVIWMLCIWTGLAAQNMVVNGGFEMFKGPVPCHFITHPGEFTINGWRIPTRTTPDIFSTFLDVNCSNYAGPGSYEDVMPFRGQTMVGIFTYGSAPNVGDWREYVQAELSMPMVPGKKYAVEYWVRIKPSSPLASGSFGVYFSENSLQTDQFTRLAFTPHLEHKEVINRPRWVQITDTIEATRPYKFMLIGNFRSDRETPKATYTGKTAQPSDILYSVVNRAYYFLDHVNVVPLDPEVAGQVRQLEQQRDLMTQVHFEHDRFDLIPDMKARLDALYDFLKARPNTRLMLAGHTDSVGTDGYNMLLSERRTYEVRQYLLKKSFPESRILTRWYGPHKPAASNATPDGRYANRRVNLEIIQ
jgi:OOP family OmpA-OmpF porin